MIDKRLINMIISILYVFNLEDVNGFIVLIYLVVVYNDNEILSFEDFVIFLV